MASPNLARRGIRNKLASKKPGRNNSSDNENEEQEDSSSDEQEGPLISKSLQPHAPGSPLINKRSPRIVSHSPENAHKLPSCSVLPKVPCQTEKRWLWLVPCFLVLVTALFAAWKIWLEDPQRNTIQQVEPTPDRFQKFSTFFPKFVSKFPHQENHSWKVVKAAVKPILQDKEPLHPAVVVLIASEEAAQTLSCFARRLANLIEAQFQDLPPLFIHVDSRNHRSDAASFKQVLEDKAYHGFQNGSHAFLIENIQEMPGESALMLHGLCDDKSAPFKQVVYLLTVTKPNGEALDLKGFEVSSLWKNELKDDVRSGLESRIGALKAYVLQENKDTLGTQCAF